MRLKTNNVYGQFVAPDGLRPVLVAVEKTLGEGTASIFRSRSSNQTETLRIMTDTADLESLPMPGGIEYLLNGSVAGRIEEVVRFVERLSSALSEAKVEHTFDIHDGRTIVRSLP